MATIMFIIIARKQLMQDSDTTGSVDEPVPQCNKTAAPLHAGFAQSWRASYRISVLPPITTHTA